MTFSLVAWDKRDGVRPEWGVAVASKFLAVGSAVPWATAGAGAVATQALANLSYGPEGLKLLSRGDDAETVVRTLTQADGDREQRQLGVVDSRGRAATFTGSDCFEWAGGVTGDGYCCQGNILTGGDVVAAMASTFEETAGALVDRLLAALSAGDDAGGDKRGKQSAAVYVVREGAGYGGTIDIAVDLRVDDHLAPVPELHRLLGLQRLYFPDEESLRFVDIDEGLADELRRRLGARGGRGYDHALKEALYAYVGTENLEERWSDEARIEVEVLEYLRSHT
jgi:uncharacterized Ntn-hydrolase superfamily protein